MKNSSLCRVVLYSTSKCTYFTDVLLSSTNISLSYRIFPSNILWLILIKISIKPYGLNSYYRTWCWFDPLGGELPARIRGSVTTQLFEEFW